jgi:hypothetical protein
VLFGAIAGFCLLGALVSLRLPSKKPAVPAPELQPLLQVPQ